MIKKSLRVFHSKVPFFEALFMFIMGALTGLFGSLFTGDIASHSSDSTWKWFSSWFIWIFVTLLVITILYFVYFSTYSCSLQNKANKEEALIDTLLSEGAKAMRSPRRSIDEKIRITMKITETVSIVRKRSGNDS
jgi:hypothetical protein